MRKLRNRYILTRKYANTPRIRTYNLKYISGAFFCHMISVKEKQGQNLFIRTKVKVVVSSKGLKVKLKNETSS